MPSLGSACIPPAPIKWQQPHPNPWIMSITPAWRRGDPFSHLLVCGHMESNFLWWQQKCVCSSVDPHLCPFKSAFFGNQDLQPCRAQNCREEKPKIPHGWLEIMVSRATAVSTPGSWTHILFLKKTVISDSVDTLHSGKWTTSVYSVPQSWHLICALEGLSSVLCGWLPLGHVKCDNTSVLKSWSTLNLLHYKVSPPVRYCAKRKHEPIEQAFW